MSEEGSIKDEQIVEVLFEPEDIPSSEEPPMEEWSSYLCFLQAPFENDKRRLFKLEEYEPPVEDICAKYIPFSDSAVYRHPYYKYPSVKDPGINEALLQPKPEIIYADDGQDLYKSLCKEMNETFSHLFHRQLLESHVNMSYYGISPYGWRPMAIALKNNKIVKSIDFTYNFISIDGCYHMGDMLRDNSTITELNFSGCRMGPEGIKNLVANFGKNSTLRKLDVSKNGLTDAGMEHLTTAIYTGTSITEISLGYNALTSISATNLADAIEYINKITHLDLSFNSLIIPKPVETLISRFLESGVFVEINLSWNALTNRFSKALSNLFLCPSIEVVILRNNDLTGECITQMADNLKYAKNLKTLDLSFNPLTIAEATYLLNKMRFRVVKLNNLLLDNINVDVAFVVLMNRILNYKFRKNAVITHGYVVPKIIGTYPNMREVVLNRADYLCQKGPKKMRMNVGQVLLQLNKDRRGEPMLSNLLPQTVKTMGVTQLNKDLVEELAAAFPGPRSGKTRSANVAAMADYVHRKWPETTLPPTPPRKHPLTPPPPLKGRGKGKNVKGKK
ncbi:hypothetical protein O0L34_g14528 [Tuta absoluta]|nr:hypothetical protein O0L34_g14527 [Tuta absoluta]KAJ2941481.1 hypothetical protein O0L34_g14528 [Tuta absoluta]